MISGTSTSIVFLFLAFSCYPFCGKEDGRLLLQEVEVLEALVAVRRIQPLHLGKSLNEIKCPMAFYGWGK